MSSAPSLLAAAGGLGLFLFGMSALKDGLASLAGDASARVLARFTRTPWSGALTGAAATALVQSSSATTVAAVGFVGAGLLSFPQALGIVFGANAGTTLTGWLVVLLGFKLELSQAALVVLLVGALLRLLGRGRANGLGLALAGFGLVFLGLDLLRTAMAALQGPLAAALPTAPTLVGRAQLVLAGLLLTIVTQSSSAGVALALSALEAGALEWKQAAALVIGMDVGTTFTAALASLGGSAAARRTGLAHVVYNLLTGGATFALLPAWTWLLGRSGGWLEHDPELALVAFHSGFNLLGVLAVLPLTRRFARLMEGLVPERRSHLVRALDPSLLGDPPVALRSAQSALEGLARVSWSTLARLYREEAGESAAREAFAPIGRALAEARELLGALRTSPERPADHERHEALMHALDHLERLAERARRGAPRRQLDGDDPLAPAVARLVETLEGLAARLDEAAEERARECARELTTADERARLSVLDRAARGELSPAAALKALDDRRNLRRVAEHVARIAHHLLSAPDALLQGAEPARAPADAQAPNG